jgi:hypothetical protein
VRTVAHWFTARGLPERVTDPGMLTEHLLEVAGMR